MIIRHIFSIIAAFVLLTSSSFSFAQTIPFEGYQTRLSGDPEAVAKPSRTYAAQVISLYDSDTMRLNIDKGFNDWKHATTVRLAGVNAYEITRKYKTSVEDIKKGYQCRDLMLTWLAQDALKYPHKAKYHTFETPSDVIIQTSNDKAGKYGRTLVVIWKDGVNLNQWLARSGCAVVTWYDGKEYDRDTAIRP